MCQSSPIVTHMDEGHISSATESLCLGYVIINLISLHLPRFCVL